MVSIIVPVYNVEPYIGKCIESIINQTYKSIEILLMEGKSSDGSLEICKYWERRDTRIRLYSRNDKGLSDARNQGIELAAGEYLMFVDSDDWLEKNAVEVLVKAAEEFSSDMVCCDYFSVNYNTNEVIEKKTDIASNLIDDNIGRQIFLCQASPTAWAKLYRTSLWKESKLTIPLTRHEDVAMFPVLCLLSDKIYYVEKPLYYYLEFRTDSLVNIPSNRQQMPMAVNCAMEELKKRRIFKDNYYALLVYARKFIIGSMYEAEKVMGHEEYQNTIEIPHLQYLDQEFPEWREGSNTFYVCGIGSFSMRWIIHIMLGGTARFSPHYAFTSIIAQMHSGNSDLCLEHKNDLRKFCVNADLHGELRERLQYKHTDKQLFFIDFMEECSDILILDNENACTDNITGDLLNEAGLMIKRRIPYGLDEYWLEWEKACLELVSLLEKSYKKQNIFLVKNRLSEKYEKNGNLIPYENIQDIRSRNADIERKENFLSEHLPGMNEIAVPKELAYTEEASKYGIFEIYSNNKLYKYIGTHLKIILSEREKNREHCNKNSGQ